MKNTFLISLMLLSSSLAQADRYSCQNIDSIFEDTELKELTAESTESLLKSNLKPTKIMVSKEAKRLFLFSGDTLLRSYSVALGREPFGPKIMEGDNRTPEGKYIVDFKKRESDYYRALHISYPNKDDVERTKRYSESKGIPVNSGGDIMIHGFPNNPDTRYWVEKGHPIINWTRGCIAVTNSEIEEIFQLVSAKTEVEICPGQKRGDKMTALKASEKISDDVPELKTISIPGKSQ